MKDDSVPIPCSSNAIRHALSNGITCKPGKATTKKTVRGAEAITKLFEGLKAKHESGNVKHADLEPFLIYSWLVPKELKVQVDEMARAHAETISTMVQNRAKAKAKPKAKSAATSTATAVQQAVSMFRD